MHSIVVQLKSLHEDQNVVHEWTAHLRDQASEEDIGGEEMIAYLTLEQFVHEQVHSSLNAILHGLKK